MVVWAAPTVMRSVSGVLLSKHSTIQPQPVSVNLIFIFILAAFRLLNISLLSHGMSSVSMGHPFFSTLGSKSSLPMNLCECPICMTTLVIRSVICHAVTFCIIIYYHLCYLCLHDLSFQTDEKLLKSMENNLIDLWLSHKARRSVLIHYIHNSIWKIKLSDKPKEGSFEFFSKTFFTAFAKQKYQNNVKDFSRYLWHLKKSLCSKKL